jgi:hypothetical protein
VPDELTAFGYSTQVIVSTIHRAKGLEFPRVVLVDPRGHVDEKSGSAEEAEETRVLYVALTRASRDLFYMESPNTYGMRSTQDKDDRWFRRRGWTTPDVELRGNDSDMTNPPGTFIVSGLDAGAVQEYVREQVRQGDPVTLAIARSFNEGTPRAFYAIRHQERVIGLTSEQFGAALFRILRLNRRWTVNWPKTIEKLRVEGIESVAGTSSQSQQLGLGVSGMWLRVRVSGLGSLVYDGKAA